MSTKQQKQVFAVFRHFDLKGIKRFSLRSTRSKDNSCKSRNSDKRHANAHIYDLIAKIA